MNIQLEPDTRGTWLIYFLGSRETAPMRGTLTEVIYQATKDGTQFSGDRLGVVIVPIAIELPAPQIEGEDGKIISITDALAGLSRQAPAPVHAAVSSDRAAEYRSLVKERPEDPAAKRSRAAILLQRLEFGDGVGMCVGESDPQIAASSPAPDPSRFGRVYFRPPLPK